MSSPSPVAFPTEKFATLVQALVSRAAEWETEARSMKEQLDKASASTDVKSLVPGFQKLAADQAQLYRMLAELLQHNASLQQQLLTPPDPPTRMASAPTPPSSGNEMYG